MTDRIPDAPYIRQAELVGMPSAEEVYCPVCGKECNSIYTERFGHDAIGCENCIRERDAYDWLEWQSMNDMEE